MRHILFDQFSDMDDLALNFWEELDECLSTFGYRVALVHYPKPQRQTRLPTVWTNYDAPWTYSHEQNLAREEAPNEELEFIESRARDWGFSLLGMSHALAVACGCKQYAEALVGYFNPALIVLWNGYHIQQEYVKQAALRNGIPLHFMEKAPVPGWLHFDKQGVLAESQFALTELKDIGESIPQSTSDALFALRRSPTWYEQPNGVGNLQSFLNVSPERKILVFFGQVDEDIQNFRFCPYFQSNSEAWAWFVEITNVLGPSWFRLGKHHPKSRTSVEEFAQSARNGYVWSSDVSMHDSLNQGHAFASVNSSASVEALLAGKPVLSVGGKSLFSNKDVFYQINPEMTMKEIEAELRAWVQDQRADDHKRNFEKSLAEFLENYTIATEPSMRNSLGISIKELSQRLSERTKKESIPTDSTNSTQSRLSAFGYLKTHGSRSAFMWELLQAREQLYDGVPSGIQRVARVLAQAKNMITKPFRNVLRRHNL